MWTVCGSKCWKLELCRGKLCLWLYKKLDHFVLVLEQVWLNTKTLPISFETRHNAVSVLQRCQSSIQESTMHGDWIWETLANVHCTPWVPSSKTHNKVGTLDSRPNSSTQTLMRQLGVTTSAEGEQAKRPWKWLQQRRTLFFFYVSPNRMA